MTFPGLSLSPSQSTAPGDLADKLQVVEKELSRVSGLLAGWTQGGFTNPNFRYMQAEAASFRFLNAEGDMMYRDTKGRLTKLGIGSSAQLLESTGGIPAWVTHLQAWPVGAVFTAVSSVNPNTLLGYGTWSAFGSGRVLIGRDTGDADFDVIEETGGVKTHTLSTSEMPAHGHSNTTHSHTQASHGHANTTHAHANVEHSHLTWSASLYETAASDAGGNVSGFRAGGSTISRVTGVSTVAIAGSSIDITSTTPNINASSIAITVNGGDGAHDNVQPYIVVHMWKRTA